MRRAIVAILWGLGFVLVWSGAAKALDWAIERNFRYFAFSSDVAVQRVARDIYLSQHGSAPTPEALERRLNDEGFWSTPLAAAGALRERWPLAWRRGNLVKVYDLVTRLRRDEGRAAPPGPSELGRLGWASLAAAGRDAARPMGFTATCWNPATRLHTNCPQWGDYVRPPGWIVRVFDSAAAGAATCDWSGAGALVVDGAKPPAMTAPALAAAGSTFSERADCREIYLFVPSDPSDPKRVAGRANVRRTSPDGTTQTLDLTPTDRLIVGFGDSFTSGEGNPDAPATFNGTSWSGGNLPARDNDPRTASGPDARAQWTDRWCHRSVYSWQVRTALDAALRDEKQSVTILPYGCSGATIFDGLLYAYNGVEWDHAEDRGVVGSRAEIGLAYQELCRPDRYRSSQTTIAAPLAAEKAAAGSDQAAASFVDAQLRFLRRDVARCGPANVFKRSADALLLDIGINDVGFRQWAEGLILDKSLWPLDGAFVPCVNGEAACDAKTRATFARLERRYALLRKTLDAYLLPDFGIDPSHVIIPVYPPALQDEAGDLCARGNLGLTVATFPSFGDGARSCQGAPLLGLFTELGGVLGAIRSRPDVASVEAARGALNRRLVDFAAGPAAHYDLVDSHVGGFARRGFCATRHGFALPPGQCLTAADFDAAGCAPGDPPSDPESMDVPRTTNRLQGCDASDTAFFRPFPAKDYEPYRSRQRLFRTQNDVYLTIDQRSKQWRDSGAFGLLDLLGRTSGGAFHPTAEAHAIVATATAPRLCQAIGCGP